MSCSISPARSAVCEDWTKALNHQNKKETSTNRGRKCVLNLVWNILAKITSSSTNKTLVAVNATIFHVVRRVSCVFGQVCSVTERQYKSCACIFPLLFYIQKCQLGPDIFYMQLVKTHINPLPCTKISVNIKLSQRLHLAFSPWLVFYICNHDHSLHTYKNTQMSKNTSEEAMIKMV